MPVTDRGEYYMGELEIENHLKRAYTVVESADVSTLASDVELLLSHGFLPHGGVAVAFNHDGSKVMAQAMIRSTHLEAT